MLSDGTLACWGQNAYGQLGNGRTSGFNFFQLTYTRVDGLSEVEQIAAGFAHTCALVADGQVYCWGSNEDSALGISNEGATDRNGTPVFPSPQRVPELDDVVEISARQGHTCARRKTGQVVCWGDNSAGQLGDGTAIARDNIREVDGLP